jgi:hypothetical protein
MFPQLSSPWWRRSVALLLSLAVRGAHAEAQGTEPALPLSNQGITAPVALETNIAPVAGDASAEVIVELLIDARGRVEQVTVVSGPEPFATSASEQAKTWKFRPALRGDQAISSRIHFLVRFTPEAKQETPEPEAEARPTPGRSEALRNAPGKSSGKAEAMSEVLVLGKEQDPTATHLSRAEVRNLAGAFGDPIRAIEALPGVTPIATGLPLFFVRGAPPGNVGYFLDGIRIPFLYHGFLGPSAIHPSFIDGVSLNAGPIPTRYGRFAGATVEASLAEPRQDFRGETQVRVFDAGAFVEAPFANGRGYALVGGRYSFTALLLSLLSPGSHAEYWDYQALAGYRLTKRDELRLFAFGAFDLASGVEGLFGTEFHRLDGRYRHEFDDVSDLSVGVSVGRDRTRSSTGYLGDTVFLSRVHFSRSEKEVEFQAGADISVDAYDSLIDNTVPEPEVYDVLFPSRTDVAGGAYVNTVLFPKSRVRVTPGIRVDGYSSLGHTAASVDPRIFAEFRLTSKVRVVQGFGIAHQTPNFVPAVPGAQVGGLNGGLQESIQAESRVEIDLPWEVNLRVGAFINGTANLSDPIGMNQSLSVDETSKDQRSLGRATGIEVMIKRPLTRRFGGLVSYTLMQSRRSFGAFDTLSGYDRPNMLNLALTYDFGAHIRGSAKFSLAEGIPGRRTTQVGSEVGNVYDGSRSAPLYRLDVKLEKRWYLTEASYLGANIEVLNATYSPNVTRRTCSVMGGCRDEGTAPLILPSIGVEFGWR